MVRSRWLRDLFEAADKDSSGTLTVKEVLALMHELNVGTSKKILTKKFKVTKLRLLSGLIKGAYQPVSLRNLTGGFHTTRIYMPLVILLELELTSIYAT